MYHVRFGGMALEDAGRHEHQKPARVVCLGLSRRAGSRRARRWLLLTGDRSFLLRDARELEKTLHTIARELRYQYLLGYAPAEPIDGGGHRWRSIRVALRNAKPGMRVRARDGYTTELT